MLERVSSTSKERAQYDVPSSMDTACVLTVAVDNAKRIVTQAAGKFNMNLNQRARPDKERRAGSLYVHLLRESGRILRLWMDQVGLTRVGNS